MAQFNEKSVLCLTKYWIPNTGSKFRTLSKPFPNVRRNDMRSWNESIQFTIETSGEILSTRQWTLLFHKRWEISWLAEQISASWCPLYRPTDVAPFSFNFSRHKPVFKRLVIYSMSIESDGSFDVSCFDAQQRYSLKRGRWVSYTSARGWYEPRGGKYLKNIQHLRQKTNVSLDYDCNCSRLTGDIKGE
jgi:hypothetical protein